MCSSQSIPLIFYLLRTLTTGREQGLSYLYIYIGLAQFKGNESTFLKIHNIVQELR